MQSPRGATDGHWSNRNRQSSTRFRGLFAAATRTSASHQRGVAITFRYSPTFAAPDEVC